MRIGPSQIKGAGLGLFLEEDANANEWIARYSGDPINRAECERRRHSQYRLQVHKNLFLDAVDKKHFEGRFINDARGSRYKTNARFAANYATYTCSLTGLTWVRIYATRKIRAGEEIFIDYGADFWKKLQATKLQAELQVSKCANPTSQQSTSSTSSSVWAAPAPSPDLTPEWTTPTKANSHDRPTAENAEPALQVTLTWPNQAIAPADPMIIGHSNRKYVTHSPTPIQFITPISPIKPHSPPNTNPHMNEIYSFTQLHDIDNTLLLPLRIVNPMNVTLTL